MAGDDRLSDLPDKLLRRILHFAPAKEAASTRALSRRWRSPLLRFSGAVNLETHVEDYDRVVRDTWGHERKDLEAVFFSRRDAFVSAAEAALDAAAADHVTRLSLRVEFKMGGNWAERFLNHNSDWSLLQDRGLIPRLLSHRAACRVEELRLASECWYNRPGAYDDDNEEEITANLTGMYTLSLGSLPAETLRVLDLVYYGIVRPPAAEAVFPRLSCLRLRRSAVHLDALQGLIDSAPALATVQLETVLITRTDDAAEAVLRCPAATVLMLDRCNWTREDASCRRGDFDVAYDYQYETPVVIDDIVLEIHAPRLRRFLYRGILRRVSLSPPPPDLTRTDLHFFPPPCETESRYDDEDPYRKPVTFWRFLQSLSSCKELKLRVNNLEDIAVLSEARRVELLPVFSNLECLQLQGMHRSKGKTAAVAIANLLRCSPVLSHLRINLTTARHGAPIDCRDVDEYVHEYLVRKFESDRDESLHLINRCSSVEPPATTVSLDGPEVDETPGLSRHSFECLQTSLRKVSLQFRFEDDSNCFGIRLVRFFVENAIVLQEMRIDSGNGKLCQHMYHKIETWISNFSMRRRRSGASSLVVLPLKR